MFNFTFMNNALVDYNLSDKEFRLLYLIVNNMSMNNTNEIEMYNGFLMDKLNICERQVRRLTSSLVEKGYITKVNTGTKNNRNANVYRLCDTVADNSGDIMCDISGDKNVPPYNSIKEYKNNISMYRDHEAEVTTEQVKLSKDELTQRNEYISAVYGKLDDRLNYLYGLKTATQYEDVCSGISEIFSDAQEHRDWFTSPQWDRLTRYCERFDKLTEAKDKYFNGKNTKIYVDESSSIEEDKASAPEHISADDSSTSTEDELTDEADLTSVDCSKGDLNLTDRFTLSQLEDKNPPQVPLVPPLKEEFNQHVMAAIRNGVYRWSLTLTDIPEYITGDDTNPIVSDALRAQPDYESHLGNISLSELSGFTKELMENRLNNKDIPAIVRENQYKKRHEAFRKELMSA